MELDLGLRISRAVENLTFSSTETATLFILFAHLPAFKKDEIEISINEAGTEISISGGGERSSIETTIPRRLMLATQVIERFQKVFRIPNGVDLDRIDAGFDEENAILIVLIPKLIIGDVSGVEIEENKRVEDERGGEEGQEASLEQDKQEGGGATSKEEEQEEKGKGEEASIAEDEQREKGEDVEVFMKEKEQEAKREGEEASLKDQQVKESLSDQEGEPELEKEPIGMEQKIPKEEGKEDRGSRVPDQPPTPPVPVEIYDLDEEPPPSEHKKELPIPISPPTPPIPVETHDSDKEPPSEPKEAECQKELKIPMAPPTPPVPVETHDLDEVPPSPKALEPEEAEQEKELQIPRAPDLPPMPQEPIKDLEIDQESREPIRTHPRPEDLGLGEEVGVEKREGNGNESGKKGRKKGKGKGGSLPFTPSLASTAFLLSLAVLAFHFLRGRKK